MKCLKTIYLDKRVYNLQNDAIPIASDTYNVDPESTSCTKEYNIGMRITTAQVKVLMNEKYRLLGLYNFVLSIPLVAKKSPVLLKLSAILSCN